MGASSLGLCDWGGGCLDYCCLGLGCLHGECTFLNIVGVLDQTCAALDVALRHSYCIVHVCGHTTAVTCTLLSYHQCRKSFFLSFFLSSSSSSSSAGPRSFARRRVFVFLTRYWRRRPGWRSAWSAPLRVRRRWCWLACRRQGSMFFDASSGTWSAGTGGHWRTFPTIGSLHTTSRLTRWVGRGSSARWWDGRSPFHLHARDESSEERRSVPSCTSGRRGGVQRMWGRLCGRRSPLWAERGGHRTRSWEGGWTSPLQHASSLDIVIWGDSAFLGTPRSGHLVRFVARISRGRTLCGSAAVVSMRGTACWVVL